MTTRRREKRPITVPRSARRLAATAALITLGLAGGCAVRQAPHADRLVMGDPAETDELQWPVRRPDTLSAYLADNQIHPWRGFATPPSDGPPTDLVSVNRRMDRQACLQRLTLRNGSYFSRGPWGTGVVLQADEPSSRGGTRYCVLMNRLDGESLAATLSGPNPNRVGREGIDRFHFELRRATTGPSRGLVVHLVSLGDLKYERSVLEGLQSRGYDILSCVPRGFTIRVVDGYDDDGVEIASPSLTEAEDLATTLDDYAASAAPATESMIQFLDRQTFAPRPIVVAGFSLGALSAPTVAVRLGDRVRAVLLVGGGANVVDILLDGALTNDIMGFVRRELGTPATRAARTLPENYLLWSRFDPYHVAPRLRGIPVLMLHARFDDIVPARCGDLLYDRLDRPERWSYPLGHLGLFWWLPTQRDRIAQWVENATRDGRRGHIVSSRP